MGFLAIKMHSTILIIPMLLLSHWSRAEVLSPNVLDDVVTPEMFRHYSDCKKLAFDRRKNEEQTIYVATWSRRYRDKPVVPDILASASVTVAKGGSLLDPQEYEDHKKKIIELDKGRPEELQWYATIFPDIGSRAVNGFALGPGGGGSSLVFTTEDDIFDVKVEYGTGKLSDKDSKIVPKLCIVEVAKHISEQYTLSRKMGR